MAPAQKEKLKKILQTQIFSLIIDESTDRSATQCLGMIVRYCDYENERVHESLWDLLDVHDTKESLANAEQLTEKIIGSLENS